MKIIDARGETCPVPVVLLKKALKEGGGENIREIVDNELSKENIEKMLKEMGLDFKSYMENDDYVVQVNIAGSETETAKETVTPGTVLVLSSDVMGWGDAELGRMLIKNFLYALNESVSLPQTILLYNAGVKLSSENPDTVADLKKLEKKGVGIMSCGLCLDYYGLKEKLQVGSVTNMYAIVQAKLSAQKLIEI